MDRGWGRGALLHLPSSVRRQRQGEEKRMLSTNQRYSDGRNYSRKHMNLCLSRDAQAEAPHGPCAGSGLRQYTRGAIYRKYTLVAASQSLSMGPQPWGWGMHEHGGRETLPSFPVPTS